MEGDRVNLGEAKASIGFVWGVFGGTAVEPDPHYVTIKINLATMDPGYTPRVIEETEFEFVKKGSHSEFFQPNNYASHQAELSGDGSTKILTIKNPEKYDLINS